MQPDEILTDIGVEVDDVNAIVDKALKDLINRYEHTDLSTIKVDLDPKAIFMLGIIGGAIGGKVIKSAMGMSVASLVAYFAWKTTRPNIKQRPHIGGPIIDPVPRPTIKV